MLRYKTCTMNTLLAAAHENLTDLKATHVTRIAGIF